MFILGIDTTRLILSDDQFKKLISELKPSSDILSPGEVALLGALIGALSAILAQLIIYILSSSKENKKEKGELIAEERSLSSLINNLYSELAWLKVSYEFWYRSFSITSKKSHYQQFLVARDRIPECKRNISMYVSNYVKAVTRFINVSKKREPISTLLNTVNNFPPLAEEPSTFDDISTIEDLNTQSEIESKRLRSEYSKLSDLLKQINDEMTKS
jgi:hypothetical protein